MIEYKIISVPEDEGGIIKRRIVLPPNMKILETFLMAEDRRMISICLEDINSVLGGTAEYIEDTGNIYSLHITKTKTTLKDTLAQFLNETPPIEETELILETSDLKNIMKIWLQE